MAGRQAVYGGGDALNQMQKLNFSSHNQPLDPMAASATSKSSLGSTTMLSFGAVGGVKRSKNPVFESLDNQEIGDELLDEYFSQPEKKRRLTVDQVQFLERSFEADNKLEPERKIQLAKELALQPRQIAIWFQNRRARWKTRQLETDYETIRARYKSLKIGYDNLLKENEQLKAEVLHLKSNGFARDTEKTNSRLYDTKELPETMPKEAIACVISEYQESKVSAMAFKNEEQSSGKREATNVDSPRLTYGIQTSLLESGDSSHVLEPDLSDLSQNGEDDMIEELLLPDHIFPKIEDSHCHPSVSSFFYGFSVEDNPCFWSY